MTHIQRLKNFAHYIFLSDIVNIRDLIDKYVRKRGKQPIRGPEQVLSPELKEAVSRSRGDG